MTGVASTVVTKPLIACLRLALGLMSLLGLTACGTDVQTTTETSTPAPQTTAPATTASATPGPKSRVLRVRIEDQEESPEFSITMPDYVAPGRYTLVVDDRSSCAFHLWGPDVDVISRDGVSRFEIRHRRTSPIPPSATGAISANTLPTPRVSTPTICPGATGWTFCLTDAPGSPALASG